MIKPPIPTSNPAATASAWLVRDSTAWSDRGKKLDLATYRDQPLRFDLSEEDILIREA